MKKHFKMALLIMPMVSAGLAMEEAGVWDPSNLTETNTGLNPLQLSYVKAATTSFVLRDAKKGTAENPLLRPFRKNLLENIDAGNTVVGALVNQAATAATTAARGSSGQTNSYFSSGSTFLKEFQFAGKGTKKGWRDISTITRISHKPLPNRLKNKGNSLC